jgi:hypothetical protein
MAGDWIKVDHTLPDKPEVYRIAMALGIPSEMVVGCLLRLWIWADQQTIDGNDVSVTAEVLERISGINHVTLKSLQCNGFVTGDFAKAMQSVGWLEGDEMNYTFPNFNRHNGNTAKTRAVTRNRVVTHRALQSNGENVTREEKSNTKKNTKRKSAADDAVPHQQIIELFHDTLPDLPAIRGWTDARKALLRARWEEDAKRQSLDWWKRFFEYVGKSDYLCGRSAKWTADLPWILKQENFLKVIEGRYHSDGTP